MLELARPHGLWLLSLLLPLTLLYVLKARASRRVVPSLVLFRLSAEQRSARRPFRRLRVQVPFVLEVLAVILLALALAHPRWGASRSPANHLGIVVNIGASMQTVEGSALSRLHVARDRAVALIDAMAPGAEAFIVAAGSHPVLLDAPGRDRTLLRASAASLAAEDAPSDLSSAIALAVQRLEKHTGSKRLVVITDGELEPQPAPQQFDLDIVTVGAQADNTSVRLLDIRHIVPQASSAQQVQVLASVAHRGVRGRSVGVALRQASSSGTLDSTHLELGPDETKSVTLSFEPAATDLGTALVVELTPDALRVDDRAYARVPDTSPLAVAIAPPRASPWLHRALLADGSVSLTETQQIDQPDHQALPAITFSVGACPQTPPWGDLVVIAPPPGPCLGALVGAALEEPLITHWDHTDPRLRFVVLDDISVARARPLALHQRGSPLVQSNLGTIVADLSDGAQTTTLLSFNPEESNWPLRASFVLFVRNLLELARQSRVEAHPLGFTVGDPVRLRIPSEVASATWSLPDGTEREIPARRGAVLLPDLRQSGHHLLSWQGRHPGSITIPANVAHGVGQPAKAGDRGHRFPLLPSDRSSPLPERSLANLAAGLAAVALALLAVDVAWTTRRPHRPRPQPAPRIQRHGA